MAQGSPWVEEEDSSATIASNRKPRAECEQRWASSVAALAERTIPLPSAYPGRAIDVASLH